MWVATRRAGLERLQWFVPRAGRAYRSTRNHDLGRDQRTNVSGLSPYVRHRLVLEEEILRAVLAEHQYSAAEKFVQEVFWRSYFKGWLEHRPGVWSDYVQGLEAAREALAQSAAADASYQRATGGATGIEPFDVWVQELVETGYLHNHARMWFASIWIFTLELPWQLGADFFLHHLLDGDPAANTLSWRWVAGLHTKGKTYLARPDNISKFTARFAEGNRPWQGLDRLAARAPALQEPELEPAVEIDWPAPFDSAGRQGLLLTLEDLSLDVPFLPAAVAVLTADGAVAPNVREFRLAATDDVCARASAKWPSTTIEAFGAGTDVAAWAQRLGLDGVAVAYQPVGYVSEEVSKASSALAAESIALHRFVRKLDRAAWPHAMRGFGRLARRIGGVLAALEIEVT